MIYCEDCDNVESTSRKGPTYRWLCLKHPNKRGVGFTTKNQWDKDAPYLYCHRVNGGECNLFERKKDEDV